MARIQLPKDCFVPSPTIEWSSDQEQIFDWFAEGAGNLVIRARAGTGKTSTLLEGVNHAPERRILMTAFNKSIADELQGRIENRNVRARTLHSLGMSFCRRHISNLRVDTHSERARALAVRAASGLIEGRKDIKASLPVVSMVANLHTKIREILVDPLIDFPLAKRAGQLTDDEQFELLTKVESVEAFAVDFGFDGVADDSDFWTRARIVEAALNAVEFAKEPTDLIDFADMIFLPLVHNWATPVCDLLVVDEAQDQSESQLRLALASTSEYGRICVCGDDRQCHPAGTQVVLQGGETIPIEDVRKGMQVVSYHERFNGLRTQGKKVLDVGKRAYEGEMLTVSTANRHVDVTPNHRFPTKLAWDGRKPTYAVYLMEQGVTSRVGCAQLLYKLGFGVGIRCHQERADRAWVLAVYDNKEEAQIAETLVSLRFGIPEAIWYEKGAIKARLLAAIGNNRDQARACLEAHGRLYEYPLWQKGNGKHIGRKIYVTEACNLINGVNLVRTFAGSVYAGGWDAVQVTARHFKGDVWSLSVEPTECGLKLYVADGILTHNSIYSFRGAGIDNLDRLKETLSADELGLKTTYRCPKSVVRLANKFVRDYHAADTAPDGLVCENASVMAAEPGDFVLSRTNAALVGPCLDLIRAGKRAYIKGSEIGKAALALIEKLGACANLAALKKKLDAWFKAALAKIGEGHSPADTNKRIHLSEQYDVVEAFITGSDTYAALLANIRATFSDAPKDDAIMCSTVHKAKGLEAPHVFLVVETFKRTTDEEDNICYVAATRAKKGLHLLGTRRRFIEGPPKPGSEDDIDDEFGDPPWQEVTASPAVTRHLIATAAPLAFPQDCDTPFADDDIEEP